MIRTHREQTAYLGAYLDIETTGLSWEYAGITVIGIYMVNGADDRLVQLVGMDVTRDNLLESLEGVNEIYTYNGTRCDLPFIQSSLDVDLKGLFSHHDLMLDCWRRNLYGGFKAVEQQLGIPRKLQGISGWDAVRLWWQYMDYGDLEALATLLEYNREDVMNLRALRQGLPVKDTHNEYTRKEERNYGGWFQYQHAVGCSL